MNSKLFLGAVLLAFSFSPAIHAQASLLEPVDVEEIVSELPVDEVEETVDKVEEVVEDVVSELPVEEVLSELPLEEVEDTVERVVEEADKVINPLTEPEGPVPNPSDVLPEPEPGPKPTAQPQPPPAPEPRPDPPTRPTPRDPAPSRVPDTSDEEQTTVPAFPQAQRPSPSEQETVVRTVERTVFVEVPAERETITRVVLRNIAEVPAFYYMITGIPLMFALWTLYSIRKKAKN